MIPKYRLNPGIPYYGYDTFVEPFFGGGAMMIHIYENNPTVSRFILNDINPEIVGVYRAIKNNVDEFVTMMDALQSQFLSLKKEDRKKFYYDIRTQYNTNWVQWGTVEEAAHLYLLMKTGFNGIWQVNQQSSGRFATPCGLLDQTNKIYDRDNVLKWNVFLQKVDIYCGDWASCVSAVTGSAFYFMDPPYRDSFTSYGRVFEESEQITLIDFCKQRDRKGDLVMYCNRDAGDTFYTDNQGSLDIAYYDVTYTAGRRKKTKTDAGISHSAKPAREILLYSDMITKLAITSKHPIRFANPSFFEQS